MLRKIIIIVLFFFAYQGHAQQTKVDSTQQEKNSPFAMLGMFTGNPGKAALYSLVLPGAGQLYNKKYWKIPLVLAIEGFAVSLLIDRTKSFNYWNQGMNDMSDGLISEFEGRRSITDVKLERDSQMQQRDYAIIATSLIHLFQVAEAFVNRHLIEFDVSDDLSLQLMQNTGVPGLALSYKF